MVLPSAQYTLPQARKWEVNRIMGDKSPKSVNKNASQKQAKNDSTKKSKDAAIAAKQVITTPKK